MLWTYSFSFFLFSVATITSFIYIYLDYIDIYNMIEYILKNHIHIPKESNRVVDCLVKCAFEYVDGWRVKEWEALPLML